MDREKNGCDMGLFCGLIISEARGVLRIKLHGYPDKNQYGSMDGVAREIEVR